MATSGGKSKSEAKSPKKKLKTSHKHVVNDWYAKSDTKMFVGAHVSIADGIKSSVTEAHDIGGQAFAMFLCSQRQWNVKPLSDKDAQSFRDACREYGFPSHLILPHGSYLMNCGAPNAETLNKSRALLLDGMKRCERLAIDNYNFHPGSTCGKISTKECIQRIADCVNYAHSNTNNVVAVLENMSKQGNTIGGDFKELKAIIDLVKDRSRVGVCLDTCHAFAAGYDLRNERGFNKMMDDFDTIIGFKYLKGLHINDSKSKLNAHLDRHESIGKGEIGINGFKYVMNESRFQDLPMILEIPNVDLYEQEIKLLNGLVD